MLVLSTKKVVDINLTRSEQVDKSTDKFIKYVTECLEIIILNVIFVNTNYLGLIKRKITFTSEFPLVRQHDNSSNFFGSLMMTFGKNC